MDDFIQKYTEKLLVYKKVFKPKVAKEFITKLVNREKSDIESELTKCLLPPSIKNPKEINERKAFLNNFMVELDKIKEKLEKQNVRTTDKNTQWIPNFKKLDDENFPSLENHELVKRKKKFVVLDKHYENKLEQGIKTCFCYSSKHPLVGNCTSCGRIQCLQEGDKVCINCGEKLMTKDEYNKKLCNDLYLKQANNQKDKLLNFQKEFYSKLQIIDDYSDWYEVSKNTWIDEQSREFAREKDRNSEITEKIFS